MTSFKIRGEPYKVRYFLWQGELEVRHYPVMVMRLANDANDTDDADAFSFAQARQKALL